MCRHLAYVGAPVLLGTLLTDPPFSLVRQSWAPRRQQHGVVNADGFGIGWYVDGLAEPARHRGAGPIWSDETFADLARVIRTRARCWRPSGRQPPAWPAGRPRPRRSDRVRGCSVTTAPWPAGPMWPSRLAWGLDPGALARLEAPTDSALLWAMTCDLLARGKPPEAALAEVVGRAVEAGGGRLTMLLTDGHGITATCWGTSLCWRLLPGGVVVASEPYDDDPAGSRCPTARCSSRIPPAFASSRSADVTRRTDPAPPDRTIQHRPPQRPRRPTGALPIVAPSSADPHRGTRIPPFRYLPTSRRPHVMTPSIGYTFTDHLPADFSDQSLRADVTEGLTATQKWLPPKWFYDKVGSELFEDITALPEYYPTRTERGILHAARGGHGPGGRHRTP